MVKFATTTLLLASLLGVYAHADSYVEVTAPGSDIKCSKFLDKLSNAVHLTGGPVTLTSWRSPYTCYRLPGEKGGHILIVSAMGRESTKSNGHLWSNKLTFSYGNLVRVLKISFAPEMHWSADWSSGNKNKWSVLLGGFDITTPEGGDTPDMIITNETTWHDGILQKDSAEVRIKFAN